MATMNRGSRKAEHAQEALVRARCGQSWSNYQTIIAGFIARGIPADQITPRENVLTYSAWLAVGRQVRKGEKGVRIVSFVPTVRKVDKADGSTERREGKRPVGVSVFHISQTDPIAPQG